MRLDQFSFSWFLAKDGDTFLYLINNEKINNVLSFYKNKIDLLYVYLVDIFVCDYIFFDYRFRIAYNISSQFYEKNLFLNDSIKLLEVKISIFKLFKSSIWMEREVYDMFGIIFFNNWDLRKILTDYTFFGFPLRKDFPLSGFVEVYFDLIKKSTFEVLIELMQEFRFFISTTFIEYWNEEIKY